MRRYIILLLITGIVWAQTDFYDYDLPYDEYFGELVLKDGTTYLGEYSKTKEKIVYFKHQDALAFQPVPVKLIQTLKLKDGTVLLHNGKIKKNKHTLGLGEYQKFSTKEKAIYDASVVVLNNKEKNYFPKSILTDSEKEIYKQTYSKKLRQRKFKYIVGSTIVTGVAVSLMVWKFNSGFSGFGGGGGMNCGPPCGNT